MIEMLMVERTEDEEEEEEEERRWRRGEKASDDNGCIDDRNIISAIPFYSLYTTILHLFH